MIPRFCLQSILDFRYVSYRYEWSVERYFFPLKRITGLQIFCQKFHFAKNSVRNSCSLRSPWVRLTSTRTSVIEKTKNFSFSERIWISINYACTASADIFSSVDGVDIERPGNPMTAIFEHREASDRKKRGREEKIDELNNYTAQ